MAKTERTFTSQLNRALQHESYLQRLAADPLGTLHGDNVRLTTAELKEWFGVPEDATDLELVELLHRRIEAGQDPDGCSG